MDIFRRNKSITALILSCTLCLIAGGLFYGIFLHDKEPGPKEPTASTGETKASSRSNASDETKAADTGLTVYIETGHGREDSGRWDTGCSWSDGEKDYEEAELMIPIAKSMAAYLRSSGVKVVTDADEDNNRNLEYTLDYLEDHPEINAFINIHCDWENAESGTMPLYRTEEQLELGKALNKGVHSLIDMPDRGETHREDLDTLNSEKVHCPAVLFETGSIKEDNHILTEKYDAYGKGLAIGMCDYLGVEFKDSSDPSKSDL